VKIFPRGNRVLVRRDEAEGMSRGGIIIPDGAKDKQQRGTVLAVDPEYIQAENQATATKLSVGDTVLFTRFSGEGFKPENGDDLLLVKDEDVIAILVYAADEQ
jgi:chaperonin GroES